MAYRMLGSLSEAEDAVQETWLRVSRAGAGGVENPGGWLTTVTARVCLNMLRERRSRREEPLSDRVVKQYERGVVFRLGRVIGSREPGLRLLIPLTR